MAGSADKRRARPIRRGEKASPPDAGSGRHDETAPGIEQAPAHRLALALYTLDHVRAALGVNHRVGWPAEDDLPRETEHQARLADIIQRGEDGRWRVLAGPAAGAEEAVESLVARAPHLAPLGSLVTMHLRGARAMGLPTSLPPVLLVGEPGLGKSWFLSRLSACLGLPYRRYSMSSSTLAEGLQGAHPCWRNAQPGMVAKTLLAEQVANPVIFVDEVDKVGSHAQNISPHRAFYALLDQSDSTGFIDDYLGFPIDASKITWVMAANDADALPPAILDRLEILHVPEPSAEQRANIAASIYAEANEMRRRFFSAAPDHAIVERLAGMTPRGMRKSVDAAMARAAADGRRRLVADDVVAPPNRTRPRIGFFN